MNADERLNKRIEIASRIAGHIYATWWGDVTTGNYNKSVAREALSIADAIIDTAIGDMTVEPK